MDQPTAPVLLHVQLNDNNNEVQTLTPSDLEAPNLGISADQLTAVNDMELDIFKVEIVNGAIQVSRLLVTDNTEDDSKEDMPHVLDSWEVL